LLGSGQTFEAKSTLEIKAIQSYIGKLQYIRNKVVGMTKKQTKSFEQSPEFDLLANVFDIYNTRSGSDLINPLVRPQLTLQIAVVRKKMGPDVIPNFEKLLEVLLKSTYPQTSTRRAVNWTVSGQIQKETAAVLVLVFSPAAREDYEAWDAAITEAKAKVASTGSNAPVSIAVLRYGEDAAPLMLPDRFVGFPQLNLKTRDALADKDAKMEPITKDITEKLRGFSPQIGNKIYTPDRPLLLL
jgi:hypothetical protein